jgi:hypothetical protein
LKRLSSALLLALVVMFTPSFVASAQAGMDHDGRWSGTSSADGSYAEVFGNGFSANNQQCVFYSALTYDADAPRQIESGLIRCNNWSIDNGMCTDGHAFVETYNGSGYACTQGYTFTNNTGYDATTYRNSATSTTFTGHINGATRQVSGFGLADWTKAETWGEANGLNNSCPSPSKGTFYSWERYDAVSGWSYASSSTIHRVASADMNNPPCWGTVSSVSSIGDFYVD